MELNCSSEPPPPVPIMELTSSQLSVVFTYSAVFAIALLGNGIMFLILCRNQCFKPRRVFSLLLHMNIAHLLVTLFYMPKEILHNYTIAWTGGDLLCRVCKFFDVFGIVLSANILICISLDRFYSIFFPLYAMKARRSVQRMVATAWLVSIVSSLPQLYMFKTVAHPCYSWFTQCVARDFVGEIPKSVVFYFSILNIIQVYFLPLVVTVVCYSLILWRIWKKSKKEGESGGMHLLRRSGGQNLERARSRTLRMTFVIVFAFLLCWTPYATVLFVFFTTKTDVIPKELRKFLYAFAVFNSALTPYLYGYFSFDLKKELLLLFACSKTSLSDRHLSQSTTNAKSRSSYTTPSLRKRSASATLLDTETKAPSLRASLKQSKQSPSHKALQCATSESPPSWSAETKPILSSYRARRRHNKKCSDSMMTPKKSNES